jgi:deoxyadenosine/deoxycytidine kinase
MATTIISPEQVYSAENVQQAVNNPISMPSDLLGIQQSVYSKYNIPTLTSQANDAYKALTDFNQNTVSQLNNASDQLVSMNKITGIQSKISRDRGIQQQGLASSYDVMANSLNSAYNLANNEFSILQSEYQDKKNLMLQFPEAGIKITDTWDKVQKRIKDFNKEMEKKAEKDAIKQALSQYGVKTKGLSRNELEKKLNGILSEEFNYNQQMKKLDLQSKLQALSGGGGTISERVGSAGANAQNALLSSKGSDGFVDPGVYISQRANYMRSGGSSADFDAQFGNLLSPQEQGSLGMSNAVSSQKAQQTATSALRIVNNMINSGSALGNAVGPISSKLPTLRGSSADFEQNFNSLKALLTLENMGVMKGVLSDKDIEMIKNASANLSLSQSEAGFKKELANIKSILESRLGGGDDPLGLGF